MLEVDTRKEELEEQEEQWPLPPQQKEQLQLQSPQAPILVWPPPGPAEFETENSDSGGRLREYKR